jgi:class 3 adenylate cyclase
MAGRRSERRLATVLFLDIVDSTHIAGEVGDRRWRELLGAFRRRVRGQLRHHHGHEQDTSGDGFFATFDRPADAVRAAAAMVAAVQAIGLDVRCGLHTGELERIDGRLGGIAAHIGARVMARAAAAEVLVTATVRDLAIGGGMEFSTADEAELKGVPGLFRLHRLRAVDDELLPAPLTPKQAGARLTPEPLHTRRIAPFVAGIAALSLVAVAATAAMVLRPGAGSASRIPTSSPEQLVTMLKINPETNKVVAQVRDRHVSVGGAAPITVVDGTLWQVTPISIVRRDIDTGAETAVFDLPPETWNVQFAFGSIWVGRLTETSTLPFGQDAIDRINPINGRVIATFDRGDRVYDWAISRQAIWILTSKAEVLEIDPNTNAVIEHGTVPHELPLYAMTAVGEKLWICECGAGRLIEFDPGVDKVSRTVEFTQSGFVIPDDRVSSQGAAVTTDQDVMWLLDAAGGTITPVDAKSGEAGSALGVPRPVSAHAFGFGALWLAAGGNLHRVDLENGRSRTIEMPDGLVAGGVALDELKGVVWASTCVPAMAAPNSPDSTDPCRLSAGN